MASVTPTPEDGYLCALSLLGLFFKDFIYLFIFLQGEGREEEGEKHQCVVASRTSRAGEPGLKPRLVP